jgi:cell fate (sporulation/competence/biofilm development) regulator YlbF (YheA/YmcA/DUF963 family)
LEEGYIKSSPTLSTFLKSVGEYKNRVRKVRERLEAHDRAKELMEESVGVQEEPEKKE